jgi:hypothetical protein
MPKISVLSKLPPEILSDLKSSLISSGFGDYEGHAKWLTEKGFRTSCSAVHRYGQALKEEILAETEIRRAFMMEFRIRCLELAAKMEPSSAPSTLFNKADELLNWIQSA